MERYFGLKNETIEQMIKDFMEQFLDTTREMGKFPLDSFLPQRASRIQSEIVALMDELHNRNNV